MGEIAVAVDCSGSVSARQLGLFQEEIRSILAGQRPRLVHVIYFDAAVQKVETYQAGEPVSLVPIGGGGTVGHASIGSVSAALSPRRWCSLPIFAAHFRAKRLQYPVIWASTENRRAPFGQVVSMETA